MHGCPDSRLQHTTADSSTVLFAGSFLLFLAGARLWKSQETFSALIMHWNVAQRELPVSE